VLGIVEWGDYQQGAIRVDEGDLLVMFSDGITEAMNGAHSHFGEQQLLSVVRALANAAPEEIQAAIFAAIRAHVGENYCRADDQTLLVAKFHNVFTEVTPAGLAEIAV
jgi:sigma-B regulation protein RsbU (phosphoserine phosphatase)